ncbi:MAG TPA: hypothetical protein VGQ11_10490, partial [Candidatus Acidoferrales bacterium]|nr:hypothetical protein [Candidatus Acidoferrales bacterium]
FRGEQLRPGMRSVPANAWLQGSKIDDTKRILEDSLPMPTYNSVLTLLWIDKDIDQQVTGMGDAEDEFDAEQKASDARWSWNRYPR